MLMLLLCATAIGYGQLPNLLIGDALPQSNLTGFYNERTKQLNTNSLRGKVVIFSFWSTYCSSCISAMPKLQQLQQKFKDSLAIILVTQQPYQVVDKFWKYNHITKNITLPSLVGDTVLAKYFQHQGVPYEVWVDAKGVVRALTTAQYVDEKNIRAVLRNEKIDWPQSQVRPKLSDGYLFNALPNQKNINAPLYYTAFSPGIIGLKLNHSYGFRTDTIKKIKHFRGINFSILDFYRFALAKEPIFSSSRNRFIVKAKDSTMFFYDKQQMYREQWIRKNAYCYESTYPMSISESQFRRSILAEIDRTFNLKSRIVRKEMLCWVITGRAGAVPVTATKKGAVYKSINELLVALNYSIENPLVINEIEGEGKVDMRLNGSTNDFEQLKKDLANYGFELQKAIRKIEVLLIEQN